MKALSIYPEWLWAMRYLDKGIENRSWRPPRDLIGKRIALHATKHFGGADCKDVMEAMLGVTSMAERAGWMINRPRGRYHFSKDFSNYTKSIKTTAEEISTQITPGAIVGVAALVGYRYESYNSALGWTVPESYAWHLLGHQWLINPIPMRGMPGLWEFDEALLPPETGEHWVG